MALTEIPIELSSTPGIVDNSNATAITIDSSENVGIGTDSPAGLLNLHSASGDSNLFITTGNTAAATNIFFGDTDNSSVGRIVYDHGSNYMNFRTNGSDAMRIDSNGNLLVGTNSLAVSSSTGSVTGTVINSSGLFEAAKIGTIMDLNRLSTDGTILNFRKDGTTVGSISVYDSDPTGGGGELLIASGNTGLKFDDQVNYIRPSNGAGALRDNTIDLGKSDSRFKDLYLSGGVYLGGTGAANKLDDYEEGTWTPTITGTTGSAGITYATQLGHYIKVGNVFTAEFVIKLSSKGTASGTILIAGLPVSVATGTECAGLPTYYNNVILASGGGITLRWSGGNVIQPRQFHSTTVDTINMTEIGNTFDIRGSVTGLVN